MALPDGEPAGASMGARAFTEWSEHTPHHCDRRKMKHSLPKGRKEGM